MLESLHLNNGQQMNYFMLYLEQKLVILSIILIDTMNVALYHLDAQKQNNKLNFFVCVLHCTDAGDCYVKPCQHTSFNVLV